METQPLEVIDFSGGVTDNYVAGPTNRYQKADNLLISNNKKLFSVPGSQIRDLVNYQIPAGQQRIGHLAVHKDKLLEQSAKDIYYTDPVYHTLLGPSGNSSFKNNTTGSYVSSSFWNNLTILSSDSFDKPIKIFKDNTLALKLITAGLPAMAAPTITVGMAGTRNYIYAFHYFYQYNVEGTIFETNGPVVEVELDSSEDPAAHTNHITNIPVLANGVLDNYDTANVKVRIFRTEDAQTTLHLIGTVNNGVTIFNDSVSDATVANAQTIYIDGGVLDDDPPPPAKFVHIVNDVCIYAHVKESGEIFSNRYRQSKKNQIDSCPGALGDDLEDEITGVSSVLGVPLILCKRSIYRVDGFFDSLGRGGLVHLRISDTVGCVSHNSIIQTTNGIFFAGQEGFYFCDGYRVQKISDEFNKTYLTLVANNPKNMYGDYDKAFERIWWSVQKDAGSLDNDSFYILDLRWGIRPDSAFTTSSDGANFAPSAIRFFNNQLIRADKRGYIFVHDQSYLTNPKVDILNFPNVWHKSTIIYDYRSCAFNFGTSFLRKWVPWILLSLTNKTNIAVQIWSINDDGRSNKPLTEIRFNSNVVWGDPDVVWGDPSILWDFEGLIEEKRRFPAGGLRCNYKQIRITNSKTIVRTSDHDGLGTIDHVAKTLTLDNPDTAWPVDSVGYFLTFEQDGYIKEYEVTGRTSSVLTYLDAGSSSPTGDVKWELKGYRKNEAIEVLSYTIHYLMLSKSQKAFHFGDSGGNAS